MARVQQVPPLFALILRVPHSLPTLLQKLASDPRCKGMPLSSFLLKPMQRITRYPLLIRSVSLRLGQSWTHLLREPQHVPAHLRGDGPPQPCPTAPWASMYVNAHTSLQNLMPPWGKYKNHPKPPTWSASPFQ